MENIASILNTISIIIASLGLLFFILVAYQKIKKERKVDFSIEKLANYFLGFLVIAPVLTSFYFVPVTLYDQDFWLESQQHTEARSALQFFGVVILAFYAVVRLTIFLPHRNEYYNIGPKLLLVSIFPGLANALIVMIISNFIAKDIDPKPLLFFFAVTVFVYIVTTRISKRNTASLGILISHKLNLMIVNKIFKIPYRKYEGIKEGKIYTLLNDDINAIFFLTQNSMMYYTATITTLTVMIYMHTLDFVSALFLWGIVGLILGMLTLWSGPIKRTGHRSHAKRELYTNLVTGLINGFKELVMHRIKRIRFQNDVEAASKEYYDARKANINVGIDTGLFSELSFTISVGISCLLFPLVFDLDKEIITSFIIAVLFLLGPVGVLINGVPEIINSQVSWKRIKQFLKTLDSDAEKDSEIEKVGRALPYIDNVCVRDVCFTYESESKKEEIVYEIGPINFEANNGELIFIIGGNGSGKTTFLKLLIGLYSPTSGQILINGSGVQPKELSEYFSVIFSDFYLFKKIYDLKKHRLEQVYDWLDILRLSEKVKIEEGVFSTINLSQGQRKRLAIIKSYLEDRPIYFYDEVAADLDPEFRSFFYNHLLMKIKEEGKILIIISHDDKYFNLADKIYKMDMGKMSLIEKNALEAVF